jgi:hypothetical protein
MKLRNLTLLHLLLIFVGLACLFSSTTAADAAPAAPTAPTAPAASVTGRGQNKLGEAFTDFTVPERAAATVGESLGFAALVVGVLAVAGVNTYYKIKSSPGGLPGYSQAIYMREQQ